MAKSQAGKLAPTRKSFDLIVSVISSHTAAKLFRLDQVRELSEDEFSDVQPTSLAGEAARGKCRKVFKSLKPLRTHQTPFNIASYIYDPPQYPDSRDDTLRASLLWQFTTKQFQRGREFFTRHHFGFGDGLGVELREFSHDLGADFRGRTEGVHSEEIRLL